MLVKKAAKINIDRNGLEYMEGIDPSFPISLYHNTFEKYVSDCIHWHWHPQLELVLALEKMEVDTADEQLILSPGDAAFINAGQLHMLRSLSSDEDSDAYIMVLSPELIAPRESLVYEKYIRPVLENSKLPYVVFRKGEKEHRSIIAKLRECIEIYSQDEFGTELALHRGIEELWLALIQKLDSFPQHISSRQNRQSQFRLKQMLNFIRQNYANRISLEDIANSAMVSKSECLRCFRSRFDMTPVQYLIHCRLELACHLLRSTNYNVKSIAIQCGFEDPGYFGRIFRNRMGISPAAYRATAINEE